MRIVVQKFGGTSADTPAKREKVFEKIKKAVDGGFKVLAVFSAMGRKGSCFATDTLISSFNENIPDATPEQRDLAASCGELYACSCMASLANSYSIRAEVFAGLDFPIITDSAFGNASIKSIGRQNLLKAFENCDAVFAAGFQGISSDGFVTTLGRGGSDTTAAALAAAFGAERCEIYTDVDGVKTADPKSYPKAMLMESLDYREMGEMASEGAKVLHTRCVEIAGKHSLRLFVKNSFSDAPGTEIALDSSDKRPFKGFVHKSAVCDFCADYSMVNNAKKRQRALFEILAAKGISLDMINICGKKTYFSVSEKDSPSVKRYFEAAGLKYSEISGCAKLSCIGSGMKGAPGVMALAFGALSEAGINVFRILDSFINISFLIKESDTEAALEALHKIMVLTPEGGIC